MDIKEKAKTAALVGIPSASMALVGVAAAEDPQPFDPTTEVTSLATSALGQVGPMILAVAAVAVGVALARFGARYVIRLVRSGGSAA